MKTQYADKQCRPQQMTKACQHTRALISTSQSSTFNEVTYSFGIGALLYVFQNVVCYQSQMTHVSLPVPTRRRFVDAIVLPGVQYSLDESTVFEKLQKRFRLLLLTSKTQRTQTISDNTHKPTIKQNSFVQHFTYMC